MNLPMSFATDEFNLTLKTLILSCKVSELMGQWACLGGAIGQSATFFRTYWQTYPFNAKKAP